MPDREKVLMGLGCCRPPYLCNICPYCKDDCIGEKRLHEDVLDLLKEQEEQKRKRLQEIADNQLSNAPKDSHEFMALDEHLKNEYKRGIYDGLQMAFEILTEDGEQE